MRILHISTSRTSGAGRGAYNLHRALLSIGVESTFLSGDALVNPDSELRFSVWERIRLRFWRKANALLQRVVVAVDASNFSSSCLGAVTLRRFLLADYDVIHIHWVHGGFLKIPVKSHAPPATIVQTLRDEWFYTGGCHFSKDCGELANGCRTCPKMRALFKKSTSVKELEKKKGFLEQNIASIVTISSWAARSFSGSALGNTRKGSQVIPNCIDCEIFAPELGMSRQVRKPEKNGLRVVFGAKRALVEERKGYHYLKVARRMSRAHFTLVIFGADVIPPDANLAPEDLVFGDIEREEDLADIYRSADVFVMPSTFETFGKTAVEAMACGIPVICFKTSGLEDIVEHGENGLLVTDRNPEALANAIDIFAEFDTQVRNKLSGNARKTAVEKFSFPVIAAMHLDVYKSVME